MQQGAQFDDRIRNLIALAQEGSVKGRTLLFSHICDLFLQHRTLHSESQTRMLVEILNELLTKVDVSVKKEIAELLSTMPSPPQELVHLLIEDDVETSAILLEKAIISDEHLIYLIRYGSDEHRHHLSRRFGMSPLVRSALEKAMAASRESRKKYNLSELDKNFAEDAGPIDEETTASLLEIIRAQKLHESPEVPTAASQTQKTAEASEISPDDNKVTFLKSEARQRQKKATQTQKAEEKNRPHIASDILELTEPINENELLPSDDLSQPMPQAKADQQTEKTPEGIEGDLEADQPAPENLIQKQETGGQKNIPVPASEDLKDNIQAQSRLEMNNLQSDITHDLSETSERAHEENSRNHDFIRSAADWFWEMDRHGCILFLSEEAFIAFGTAPQSLIGDPIMDYCQIQNISRNLTQNLTQNLTLSSGAQTYSSFEDIFEHRRSFRDQPFLISSASGEQSLWYLSGIAIFDTHSGKFKGFRGSARTKSMEKIENFSPKDSPQDTQIPASLPEQETGSDVVCKEDIAAELLQNLSHEFRTPLNAIIGFSEMIDMEAWGPVNEQYHQHTRNILDAANHLKESVNDVLDSAKLESGLMEITPESFSLKSVIKNSMENILELAKKHGVTVDNGDNNIDVILYNDKQSVELCLTKMLASSIKRAHKHNIINLTVMVNSNAEVRIEIPLLGDKILEKDAATFFDKLQNGKEKNNNHTANEKKYASEISPNFGLSIARNLANLIGGDIVTHSVKGLVTHLALTITNHPHQD